MQIDKDKKTLIIANNISKDKIIKNISKEKDLYNIKILSLEEFKKQYFFTTGIEALEYLVSKYNLKVDVAYKYLDNLYVIDINKNYNNSKLDFLKQIKKELIDNNLLIFNSLFKKYLETVHITILGYVLDKYEEDMFKDYDYNIYKTNNLLTKEVVKACTLEDEISYVIETIIKLINNNVSLNNIYLTNVDDSYYYLLTKMFSYFNIPLNFNNTNNNIYATKYVKDYLKTKKLIINDTEVCKKLVNVLNSLVSIKDSSSYLDILTYKLKHTYLLPLKYDNAVNVINDCFNVNNCEYLFVLGFNLGSIPKTYNDIDYIDDVLKDSVNMYKTTTKNKLEKDSIINTLGSIKNLYLSYKETSNFTLYYPSVLIEDLNLKVVNYTNNNINYSNIYNKIILGEDLDKYYKYNIKDTNLTKLNNTYSNTYNTYDNSFKGIDVTNYLSFIKCPLTLSYSSINNYNLCGFKYYINNVLKIDPYQDSFASFIGSLYHNVLSLIFTKNFNLDKAWESYLETRELSFKEKVLLARLKDELKKDIEVINKQKDYSNFSTYYLEKEVNIPLSSDNSVIFKGYIDKIMFYKYIEDTYYTVIDYKSGSFAKNFNNLKYGLDMQLVVYLYLVSNSRMFENPINIGFYYQQILPKNILYKENIDINKELEDNMKLIGYTTDNINILKEFDKTLEDSKLIKGLKIKNDSLTSKKILNDVSLFNIITYTENKIKTSKDNIMSAKFNINPKVINDEEVACKYCTYKDICYVKDKDKVLLPKVDNLDFLEEN